MSEKTYLVKDATVLTLGPKTPNHVRADVLIENGRLAEIGAGLRSRSATVVDASGSIVMPGFVDTHRHSWLSLFRNFEASTTSPWDLSIYGPHYGPDDVYAGTLAGLLGAIESGITTVVDWVDVATDEDSRNAALQAHADAGARTVFVLAAPPWSGQGPHLDGLRAISQMADDQRVTSVAAGMPDPVAPLEDSVIGRWAQARELGLRVHVHVGVDSAQRGVAVALAGAGLLDHNVTLVHCSELDGSDLDAIASSGAGVALTPSAEMVGGLGSPPIQALIDRNIRPGLGVDDERVTPGDLFAQMRVTNSIQHATAFDLKLSGKSGVPTMLNTREVIRYATYDGAAAVGLSRVTGSLEVGKRADLIVLRADRPNISPVNDPIGAVVWGMDTSNIDWVFVDGKPRVAGGEFQHDLSAARSRAQEAQERVLRESGLSPLVEGAR